MLFNPEFRNNVKSIFLMITEKLAVIRSGKLINLILRLLRRYCAPNLIQVTYYCITTCDYHAVFMSLLLHHLVEVESW